MLQRAGIRVEALVGVLLLMLLTMQALADPAHTNPMNLDPQVREAYEHYYSMDYVGAVERFARYRQGHAQDPHAAALLLNALIFEELNRQDALDTTFYANDGFLSGRHATHEDPKARERIFTLADEAVREADWRIQQNPRDIDALFDRAWVRGLRCAYVAMVERSFGTSYRLATKARADAERCLELDPQYVDAKLITGVYQYGVGSLPLGFKLLLGIAGITGSKTTGLEMLRDAGERGVNTSLEARTAMVVFLRRDGRFAEALELVRGMKRKYPRNFLMALEEANLEADAGDLETAVAGYRSLLAASARAEAFPEARLGLAEFGLGKALGRQSKHAEAAASYERAAATAGASPELRIRSLVAAGECRDQANQREQAVSDYQQAIAAGPGTSRAETAQKRLRTPYRGH